MRLTGSKTPRWWNCEASVVLPQVEETDLSATEAPKGSMSAMSKGKMIHFFLENWLNLGFDKALELVTDPDIRELCANINANDVPWLRDRDSTTVHPDCRYYSEVAFSYNVKTGSVRHLGNSIERNYSSVSEDEVALTIDYVGVFSDHLHVGDYKTGIGAEGYTDKAINNKQVALGALVACRFYRRPCARVSINHVHDDGHVTDDSTLLTELDIDAFEQEFKRKWNLTKTLEADVRAGKTPDVHRGPWCRYCQAANSCPAVVSMIRAAAADPNAVADGALEMLAKGDVSPELATKAYQRWRELKSAVDRVGKALIGYSQRSCIPISDTKVYGPHPTRKKEIDAEKARALLENMFGKEAANAGCTFETSAAAIERGVKVAWEAAKASGLKVTKKAMVEEVMESLKQQGAIKVVESSRIEEYEI